MENIHTNVYMAIFTGAYACMCMCGGTEIYACNSAQFEIVNIFVLLLGEFLRGFLADMLVNIYVKS